MKTSISTEQILKSRVLFFSITAFILSVLVFTSCAESTTGEGIETDEMLISEIENATKVAVSALDLPSATSTAFNDDLVDSYVTHVQLADDLGYKVALGTDNQSRTEDTSEVFFSIEGRQLDDNDEARKRRRGKCFQFVFPVDFIMPDNSSITLNSKDDWVLLREWYSANTDTTERPMLVFPVVVTLEDGTEQTLLDSDELKVVKDSCKKGRDKRKCFKLVLPVTFIMPDATEITVVDRKDYRKIRRWKKANPAVEEKPTLNFPVNIIYKDKRTATIYTTEEMDAAKESCED